MDRDDPTRRPITQNFEDDPDFGGPAPEENAHESAQEWEEAPAEEPIDDFADPEQAFAEEQIERNEGTELPSYAQDEEGPMEEEFASAAAEDDFEQVEGDVSDARSKAEQYLPPGMSEKKPASPLMKYLPYGLTAIVLIVFGFFGIQQISNMMNGNAGGDQPQQAMTPPPVQPKPQADNTQPPEQPVQGQQPLANNNAPTPLGASPDALPPQAQPQQQPSPPQPGTNGEAYILRSDGTRAPMTPEVQAQMAQQAQQQQPPQAMLQPQGQPPVQQPAPGLPAPNSNVVLESQLAAVTSQLEDMKKTQTQLQDQLQKAQAQAAAATPAADVQAMQNKIADLEQRLNEAQAKAAAPAPATTHKKTSVIAKPSNKDEDLPPVTTSYDKPVRSAHKSSRKSKASGDSEAARLQREQNAKYGIAPSGTMGGTGGGYTGGLPQAYPPSDGGPQMAVNAAGGGWILRSAQPGSAWLSQGMSSDLTRVVPGDKVPGLGTVVSVRMVGGRWLVEGTQGSVR